MRLSVRQRWSCLLSEIGCPNRRQCRPNTRQLRPLPAPASSTHLVRLFTNSSSLSCSPLPPPPTIGSAVFAPPPSSNPADSPNQYHQALALAARAAYLGHPHAVIAIMESLRQHATTTALTHPAIHNQLLRAYLHCKSLPHSRRYERMTAVWKEMLAENVECNERTYSLLLNGCIRQHRQWLNKPSTETAEHSTASTSTSSTQQQSRSPSCLSQCLAVMEGVPLTTSVCNLLIKAALLSADYSFPFTLFQRYFPPLIPNASTLSLLVDTALATPSTVQNGGSISSAMEWYVRVRETGRAANSPTVAGTPDMYAKLMRRCLQDTTGSTREVQHVPVLFSHMEEAGVRAEAEHIRCLLLALSRLQLNGAGWGVWQKMESERRVQRTDETDALMLRVMSEEKDHKRAMQVVISIEQRWAATTQSATSVASSAIPSTVVSNYRSAISNFSRNGHSTTLLALLSHVFSSRYSAAVLRDGLLDSVVRRWCEAGRGVDELRAKVRQWVAAVDSMSEQELDGWQTLAGVLAQRRTHTALTSTASHQRNDVPSIEASTDADVGSVSMDVDGMGDEHDGAAEFGQAPSRTAPLVAPPSMTSVSEAAAEHRQLESSYSQARKAARAVLVSGLPADERFGEPAHTALDMAGGRVG